MIAIVEGRQMAIQKCRQDNDPAASSSHDSRSAITDTTQTLQYMDTPTGPSRHVEHKECV